MLTSFIPLPFLSFSLNVAWAGTMRPVGSVLIVSNRGPLRDGLRAMLNSMPAVRVVESSDMVKACSVIERKQPGVVILGYKSLIPCPNSLLMAKEKSTRTRFVVLVSTVAQRDAALAAGADVALLEGTLAAKLFATIEDLLDAQYQTV